MADPNPELSPQLQALIRNIEAMPTPPEYRPAISYTEPRRQPYGGQVGASAGSTREFAPLADLMRRAGVQSPQGSPWQDLSRFAPAVEGGERVLGQVPGAAYEATGVPSAMRSGEALAQGDTMRGIGQALSALPSRAAAIPGMILSEAEAAPPDPRQKRLDDIARDIAKRENTIKAYANKQFPTRQGRTDATKLEQDAIGTLRGEATRIRDAMNADTQRQLDAQRAAEAGADWAKKPFQQRYPGVLEGGVGTAATIGGVVPFLASRGRVRNFTSEIGRLDDAIMDAVGRANNTTLRQGQTHAALARERTQAGNDARALQAQRAALAQEGSGAGGVGHHLGAGAAGGGFTELPMAGSLAYDYLAGRSDPSGELYDKTIDQVNVVDHPGSVLGRYAIPFGLGFAAGGVGDYLGSLGGNIPEGHAGVVSTLKHQYRAPRRR
jgi:hypothetical protein